MTERFLIYRAGGGAGLGHIFLSILNCLELARVNRQVLAIDYRNFNYFSNDRHFNTLANFDVVSDSNVRVEYDLKAIDLILPRANWLYNGVGIETLKNGGGGDVVAIDSYLVKGFYRSDTRSPGRTHQVRLRGELKQRVDEIVPLATPGSRVGVHFRHGNGEGLDGRFDTVSVQNHEAVFQQIKDSFVRTALAAAEKLSSDEVSFFIAGDNQDFVDYLLERLPHSLSLGRRENKPFREASFGKDMSRLAEATADLWSLMSCDRLVYAPSQFPDFAVLNSLHLTEETTDVIQPPTLRSLTDQAHPAEAAVMVRTALYAAQQKAPFMVPQISELLAETYSRLTVVLRQQASWVQEALYNPSLREVHEALRNGEFDRADRISNQATATRSNNPLFHVLRARVLLVLGRAAEALNVLYTAVGIDLCTPSALVLLSDALDQLGLSQRAVETAERAVQVAPEDRTASTNLEAFRARLVDGLLLPNVALGKPCHQSSTSRWSRADDANGAVNGVKTGRFGFHTAHELNPWWIVDLGRPHKLFIIRIYNRLDAESQSANSLKVEIRQEDQSWTTIFRDPGPFGGVLDGNPLIINNSPPLTASSVRLSIAGPSCFHLDEVEVYGLPLTDTP